MISAHIRLTVSAVLALTWVQPCAAQRVTVVNVIPRAYSGESRNNPEPGLAINPSDGNRIALTAHLPGNDVCVHPKLSGVFVSTSAGDNWTIACVLTETAASYPMDLTTRFNGDGSMLFVSHLRPNGLKVVGATSIPIASVSNVLPGPLTNLVETDQPQVRTRAGATTELAVAVIDRALKTGACGFARFLWGKTTGMPTDFTSECLDFRSQESPWAIRLAVHSDGTTYVAFLSVTTANDGTSTGDVVVMRGTPSASSGKLEDLRDEGSAECKKDNKLGVRAACGVPLVWETDFGPGVNGEFGWEVRRGSLALAVDPNDAQKAYVAWADGSDSDAMLTLRVRGSTDGGKTWSDLFDPVRDATNPALAVDARGRVGFLYQQFVADQPPRWETHLAWTDDKRIPTADITLAATPAGPSEQPLPVDDPPYQGDFVDLVAVGSEFLGAFSARNDPDAVSFPFGVKYNRRCSGGVLKARKGNKNVQPSVDPFFFRVQPDQPSNALASGSGLIC